MSKVIRKEAVYPDPPEAVWVALTDPHALAEWLMPNDFKPVKGHRFRFMHDPMFACSGLTECEVLDIEAPNRMVWSWVVVPRDPAAARHRPMTITWTLRPEGAGTRLILEHVGAEVLSWFNRFSMNMGWGTMIKRWIPKVLRNVHEGRFTPGAIPLNKRCYKTKTIPAEMIR